MTLKDIGKRIAIHCDTEEKANKLLQICERSNMLWRSGSKPTERNYWQHYKEQTCYVIDYNLRKIFHTSIQYRKNKSYCFFEFEEFYNDMPKNDDETIGTIKSLIVNIVISIIHKNDCELEVLEHLQKWFMEQNND